MFALRRISKTDKTTEIKQIAQWIIDDYPVMKPHNIETTK